MKLNRKWLLAIALVLSLTMAIGGTLAYLTDRATVENVFTMGNVDIEVEEDFEQNSPLYPGVEVDKEAGITNTHRTEPAYVWMVVSVPADLDKYIDLGWASGYTATKVASPHDGYTGYLVKYPNVLDAGDKTGNLLENVKLNEKVDYQNGEYVYVSGSQTTSIGDLSEVKIIVDGYAIQTEGFADVNEAYTDYTTQWGGLIGGESGVSSSWDGTSDSSWYNDTDTEFVITTPEQLAGFADLVDGGNTFEGKIVKLGRNIDLNNNNFKPIGDAKDGKAFKGVFDGQNYTVGNVFYEDTNHSNGNLYNSLFSYTDGATIKNLKMNDILIARYGGELAAVTGLAKNTSFENIALTNSRIAGYNNSIGGIVSEAEGNCTFKNVNVDASNSVGTFWGSYDTRVGGIVGYALEGSVILMEDCTVACQIDSVNDACSNYMWYNYRRAGMLIGEVIGTEVIDGVTYASTNGNLTCSNVNVIYDDWANYHYCEFEANGQGSYNEPDEYKFSRVEGTEYNGGHDISQCQHTAVEDHHNELLVFNQLYGGGQGVKGQPVHAGVTVTYNN